MIAPPAPITGSAMKAATVSGPSRRISSSSSGARRVGELLLALAVLGEAVMVRAGGVQDVGDRQVEVGVVRGQAGERGRGDRDAVIASQARDDLLLLRPPERVVHVPDELDLGVVRLRARRSRRRPWRSAPARSPSALGELDRRVVAAAGEEVREGQLRHLLAGGLDELARSSSRAPCTTGRPCPRCRACLRVS